MDLLIKGRGSRVKINQQIQLKRQNKLNGELNSNELER